MAVACHAIPQCPGSFQAGRLTEFTNCRCLMNHLDGHSPLSLGLRIRLTCECFSHYLSSVNGLAVDQDSRGLAILAISLYAVRATRSSTRSPHICSALGVRLIVTRPAQLARMLIKQAQPYATRSEQAGGWSDFTSGEQATCDSARLRLG